MTREEVIKGLTSLLEVRRKYLDMQTIKDEIECLEMAIKTLEQQPCEDCISRQAVLDAIMANCIWENEYNLTSSRIKKAVEKLPHVTPQPKTGKWIYRTIRGEKRLCCSACGEENGTIYEYRFCPWCGAKMMEKRKYETPTIEEVEDKK